MSAVVCGKRSFFEDIQAPSPTSPTPPVAKKLRYFSSTSPIRFSPTPAPPPVPAIIHHLRVTFPDMENELLEKTLEECGYDLESAIRRLQELHLGYAEGRSDPLNEGHANGGTGVPEEEAMPSVNASSQSNLPVKADWVDLFVHEMSSSRSIDEARSRAARLLDNLERSITANAGAGADAEAAQSLLKDNVMLKEQIEALLRENSILKRAVSIQHERQKEYNDRNQEVQQLKQLVAQYQEQLRTLELNNYALTMHFRQAQQGSSMPGRFHPDVF